MLVKHIMFWVKINQDHLGLSQPRKKLKCRLERRSARPSSCEKSLEVELVVLFHFQIATEERPPAWERSVDLKCWINILALLFMYERNIPTQWQRNSQMINTIEMNFSNHTMVFSRKITLKIYFSKNYF